MKASGASARVLRSRGLTMTRQLILALALASTGLVARPNDADAQLRAVAPHRPVAPPPADPHASLGVLVGVSTVHGSSYERVASQWGYGTFGAAMTASLEGGVWVTPWLSLGARLGMLRSESDATTTDGSRLALESYDLGGWARLGAVLGRRRVRGFLGVQLEAGAQWASIDLRDASTSKTLARVAVLGVGQMIVGPVAFGFRLGPRFGVWTDAGGEDVDLDLGGIEFSTGVEVRL